MTLIPAMPWMFVETKAKSVLYDNEAYSFEVMTPGPSEKLNFPFKLDNMDWANSTYLEVQGLQDSKLFVEGYAYMFHFRPFESNRLTPDAVACIGVRVYESYISDTHVRYSIEFRPELQLLNDPLFKNLRRYLMGKLHFPLTDRYVHLFKLGQMLKIDIVPLNKKADEVEGFNKGSLAQ